MRGKNTSRSHSASNGMKKTLVIMGTHPKGPDVFDWSRKDCDIWLFNEAPNAKKDNGEIMYPKANAFFQMHHEAIWKSPKNRSDENHYNWLKSGKTPTAYMQKKYKEVPKSVRYPIESVLSLVKNVRIVVNGKEKDFKYFSCSPDFALALVADMWKKGKRYKRVEVWGIELETESEYQYQRTGFAFWTGYLAGLGVNLFLNNSIFDAPMYGYEGDVAISSKDIEKRIADLTKEIGDRKQVYTKEAKIFLDSLAGLLNKDISAVVQEELRDLTKRGEPTGILSGKIRESQRYLEKAVAMEKETGSSVFALGEFDGARLAFNKQYFTDRAEAERLSLNANSHLKKLLNLKKGSHKRQRAVEEFGNILAELMNKNMLLFHIVGATEENQYYVNSVKLSIRLSGGGG